MGQECTALYVLQELRYFSCCDRLEQRLHGTKATNANKTAVRSKLLGGGGGLWTSTEERATAYCAEQVAPGRLVDLELYDGTSASRRRAFA